MRGDGAHPPLRGDQDRPGEDRDRGEPRSPRGGRARAQGDGRAGVQPRDGRGHPQGGQHQLCGTEEKSAGAD